MPLDKNLLPKIVKPSYKNGWKRISDEKYHADKKALNSGALRAILESPEDFLIHQTEEVEQTAEMLLGSAVHLKIFEPERFAEKFIEMGTSRSTWAYRTAQRSLAEVERGLSWRSLEEARITRRATSR